VKYTVLKRSARGTHGKSSYQGPRGATVRVMSHGTATMLSMISPSVVRDNKASLPEKVSQVASTQASREVRMSLML